VAGVASMIHDPTMTSMWAEYRPDASRGAPPDGLVVRAAGSADCDDIAQISHERDGVDVHDARERCDRDLGEPKRILLVAAIGSDVVGFARAGWLEPPAVASGNAAPAGWYLLGVVVRDQWRRYGIGLELSRRRLAWISDRARVAYYFANARNHPSIDLHAKLGFVELTRDFAVPGASFEGGDGILFRVDLRSPPARSDEIAIRSCGGR
jgi:GNAT superfamily N-acetyltransferase